MQLANVLNYTEQFKAAVVGMQVTEVMWTDRKVHTVISVSPSGKTATIRSNRNVTNPNFSTGGYYVTEEDPNGFVQTIRLTKTGWRRGGMKGTKFLMDVASAYHDFNF
jgi:hypothetical protein